MPDQRLRRHADELVMVDSVRKVYRQRGEIGERIRTNPGLLGRGA